MTIRNKMKYTFGDTKTADDRLLRIATFFNPKAHDFICNHLEKEINCAIDLGCGPGHTTNMLQLATSAKKVIGLDISGNFVDAAKSYYPNLTFRVHDITQGGFPEKADCMYSRFLLSHLTDINAVLNLWIKELNNDGMLFIDELEEIQTNYEIFKEYLEISTELVSSQGASLFIGKQLENEAQSLNVVFNESIILPVENKTAAWWFYPNTVSVWKTDTYIKNMLSETEREYISNKLLEISETEDNISNITWKMKRLIIKK